jgi:hypothetical protein
LVVRIIHSKLISIIIQIFDIFFDFL